MKIISNTTIAFLLFLSSTTLLYSQGNIAGTISDSLNGSALIGANVIVIGTSMGSATDLEGTYKISRIPVGNHKLRVSYLGYRTKEFNVNVLNDRTLSMDVSLVPDIVEGETVIVTAQAAGQIAAINQQLAANTIVNVISEEKIQELPDANAAEAIGRLPGVSLSTIWW